MSTALENLFYLERALRSPTPLAKAERERNFPNARKSVDSIESVKMDAQLSSGISERPSLPAPNKSKYEDYVTQLAAAFSKVYATMDKAVTTMTRDFASTQQLDQTMSKSVLDSSQLAINKERHDLQVMEELAQIEREQASVSEKLNIAFWVLGGVMTAACIVSAVWSAGLSLLVVPEEVAAMTGEEAGADAAMEGLDESAASAETSTVSSLQSAGTDEMPVENEEDIGEATRTSDQVSNQSTKSENLAKRFLMQCLKRAGQSVLTAFLSAPNLVDGIANMQLSGKEGEAAGAQAAVGPAVARMQENNMYFQFYQQLINREGGNLMQEIEGTADVVGTYSDIMNAVRQVSYGLANRI